MSTVTMEVLAERLYTSKAHTSNWQSEETGEKIPAWSDTQRTVKNAWYSVAQESIDAGETPPAELGEKLYAAFGKASEGKSMETLAALPEWSSLAPEAQADWSTVAEVSGDVSEDLRQDVKPLPSRKGQAVGDVVPPDVAVVALDPVEQNFPSSGGAGSFTVTITTPGVSNTWKVTKEAGAVWLTIDSPPEDTPQLGAGTVSYTVAANLTLAELRGALDVNGQTHTAIVAPAPAAAPAATKKANHK